MVTQITGNTDVTSRSEGEGNKISVTTEQQVHNHHVYSTDLLKLWNNHHFAKMQQLFQNGF